MQLRVARLAELARLARLKRCVNGGRQTALDMNFSSWFPA
jgi:hypothetical protein